MTDDQFEKMMERLEDRRSKNLSDILNAILPAREDRERLIKIEAKIESSIGLMSAIRSEDLAKITQADAKASAAHRRLDAHFYWSVGTIVVTVGGMILTALFVYIRI